jgi:hypothetical protein
LVAVDRVKAADANGGERETAGALTTVAGENRDSSCVAGQTSVAGARRDIAANNDADSPASTSAAVGREDTGAARRTVAESVAEAHAGPAVDAARRDSRAGQRYGEFSRSRGACRATADAFHATTRRPAGGATQDGAECHPERHTRSDSGATGVSRPDAEPCTPVIAFPASGDRSSWKGTDAFGAQG